MNKLKVIVVASETESRITAKNLLENENFAISAYVECKSDSFLKINGIYPDVVLCMDEGDHLIYELSRRIYVSMPGVLLVMATDDENIEHNSSTVEFGFHMIVGTSIDADEFVSRVSNLNAIEKKRLTDDQRRITNAQILSVYSAKGGSGKTMIATNLALLFTQRKKKTLLIDASFYFGDVSLYLDINPKDTISELVQEGSNITIDTINSFTVLHSSGLNILPAPKSPESAEYITEEHIEKLLSIMRPYYDVIIIDLPVVLNNTTLAAIENSDTVLYVATPDIASLKDVFQVQKVMQSLQQHDKFKLLLNRLGSGTLSLKDIKNNCAYPIIGTLHEDEKTVSASISKGSPLILLPKKTRLAMDFQTVFGKMLAGEL